MNTKTLKRVASTLLKCGAQRVRLRSDAEARKLFDEAVTRDDVRALIAKGFVWAALPYFVSRARARARQAARRRGLRRGHGKRRGTAFAKLGRKERWMARVRAQRAALKALRAKLSAKLGARTYGQLRAMIKAGQFRDVRHLKAVVRERIAQERKEASA